MNRVAIDLGFFQVYWYSLMIALGVLVAIFLVLHEGKKKNYPEDFLINLIFYGIILAIIGARIYYVIFNLDYYSSHIIEMFEIWNGGLAIHGGILAGGLFCIYYCKKHNYKLLEIVDIVVVGLIIGQAIGRWGNFFNQEAYGGIVSLEFLKNLHLPDFIIDGMKIGANYYHPTFLYESIWNIIGFIILLIIRRNENVHTGQVTAVYMMWYGLGRLFIEGLRTDSLMLGNIKMAQLLSIMMVFVGGLLFYRIYKKYNNSD